MKKIFLLLFCILSAITGTHLKAQDATFIGAAPSAVIVGTRFQLVYEANVQNATNFRLAPSLLENFDNLMGPSIAQSNSIRIENGKQTSISSTSFTTILVAKKEGTYKIEPATVKIGNSEYKSNEITINVLPPDQASQVQAQGRAQQGNAGSSAQQAIDNESDIFIRTIVSDRSVYEQEGFLATIKLYYSRSTPLDRINNVKFPEFEGFFAQDIEIKEIQRGLENYNGVNYNTAILKQTILYPQRSGQITIGSGRVEALLRVRRQSSGRGFFEDFFDSYQNVPKELISSPVTIDVKPLPTGKPASFSGAVGNYTVTSEINKKEIKTNEAVTVKLTIKGNGNIKLLKNPGIKFPNDFEIYDPVEKSSINVTTAGVSGTKTIEYMAIPRFAGDFEIPAANFSFFDTKTGTYKTLSTTAYAINVEKGEGGSDAPVMSNFTNRESVKFLGKDIRYIKVNNVHFISNKEIFFGSFLYVMAYLMITILFIAFFIIYRKQVKENSNIALVRTKKANKTAVKRLKQAEKLLSDNKEEAFYEEILRALWGYLSDKLNIQQSVLTKDNVTNELAKYGVDEALSKEFLEIINTCEFARYAPNMTSGAMDKLFKDTIDAIGKMESTIKK